ncbi:hypothetical protein SKAU_G00019030 [Synaphobranchus kaupii]|uniref:SCAN box domain-containing protein n=1 Tax=Synaphobranchus kaupii TaxID=118154 RepID=A0A9Q1GBI0_SYNKA|nr:hypothetical protein SKAU_G00019030 [Synaphobranchus kaupii]
MLADTSEWFPHFARQKWKSIFERVAITLKWPKDAWSLLLECVLVGKDQDAYSSLLLEQSLDYEEAKAAVLRAYELVPEACRQKCRRFRKADSQTFVEFAREKESMFDRWCAAQGVKQFEQLRDLMIMEEFKNCLPERVATYLNEQKVTQVAKVAVLADKFSLTHASLSVGKPPPRHNDVTPRREFPGSSAGPLKASAPVSGAGQETSGNKGKVEVRMHCRCLETGPDAVIAGDARDRCGATHAEKMRTYKTAGRRQRVRHVFSSATESHARHRTVFENTTYPFKTS